jgi:2-dehydropantoate 2-reductase
VAVLSIAVLGPGGVGGFLAAVLSRAGQDVIVIAREATVELIARDGIAVESVTLGDFTARPEASEILRKPVDVLLITTKAATLESALRRISASPGLVVPLLNGLDHMATVRGRLGAARVAAGTIRIESHRPAPGRVVQTSPSVRVELAADDPALRAPVRELAAALPGASIPTEIGSSEAQILWSKLARLCPLACTTSAADRPIGFIRTDPEWRAVLEACVAEAAAVANADGAVIDPGDRLAELHAAHPDLGSSMQRDLVAGREPELDAIAGSVLRAAARHGLDCPTIARLAAQIAGRVRAGAATE